MSNNKNVAGKNDNFRRKWNPGEYSIKAQIRANDKTKVGKAVTPKLTPTSMDPQKPMMELLKAREYLVDLEKKVGKSFVINKSIGALADGGYYCDVCDCSLRDSSNFLDHINGRKHQVNLGISMKVERSSLDQVKERIKMISQKKLQEQNKEHKEYDLDESIAMAKNMERDERQRRKELNKQKKIQQKEEYDKDLHDGVDDEMMKVMGFSSFKTSKK